MSTEQDWGFSGPISSGKVEAGTIVTGSKGNGFVLYRLQAPGHDNELTSDAHRQQWNAEREKHARLFAAAPAMYEAIEGLVQLAEKHGLKGEWAVSEGRAAMSKAEGRE